MWTTALPLLLVAAVQMFTFQIDAIDVTLFPKWNAVVFHNADFFVKIIEPVHNMVRCTLKLVVGSEMVLLQSGTEDTNAAEDFMYWGEGLSSGECGVKAHKVQPSSGGKWTLSATNSTGTFSGIITITVFSDVEEMVAGESLILGETGTVQLGPTEHLMYCYMRHPDGHVLAVLNENCQNHFSPVTINDGGEWSALYAVEGSMLEQNVKATYTIKEKLLGVHTSIEKMESGALNLLCRLHNFDKYYDAKFCRFVQPDGTGLHVSNGIGNGLYSYYGIGLDGNSTDKEMRDCGITIHSPREEDYGTWKCVMHLYSTAKGHLARGNFLKVERPGIKSTEESLTVISDYPQIVALNNTSVTLQCKVNASLKGCWLRHPSGLTIHPSSSKDVKYDAGMELGECAISMLLYNEDSGNWTCNVALEGELLGDRQVTISVTVTESKMMIHKTPVAVSTGKEVKMLFRATVDPRPLELCHWVRPDGLGLTFDASNRNLKLVDSYSYHGVGLAEGECGLQISSVRDADFGNWTCTVILDGDFVQSVMELPQSTGSGIQAGVIVGSVLAVVALGVVGVSVLVYWKLFRASRRLSNSSAEQELSVNESL